MELNPDFWRRCSSCKTPIKYSAAYYVCSVSTCNRKRIGYVFDSVHCWERHLPGARHKDAAAVEARSPSFAEWKAELGSDAVAPVAKPVSASSSDPTSSSGSTSTGQSSMSSPKFNPPQSSGPRAPTADEQAAAVAASRSPQRVIVKSANDPVGGGIRVGAPSNSSSSSPSSSSSSSSASSARPALNNALEAEILVVVSKMKNYIRERSEMNTSDSVMQLLSDRLRRLCDNAIDHARSEGRKTVMDRDFDR